MREPAQILKHLKDEMTIELKNILNYWSDRTVDHENGGFYGRINGKDELIPTHNKGSILNARILWAFSSAYRVLGNKEYLELAHRAKNYIIEHFWDRNLAGVFWMLDYNGNPVDKKKQIYAQAFAIYALTEYYKVTEDSEALDYAIWLFDLIEQYSYDKDKPGYFEAYSDDWILLEDLRLSEKDANEKKTMNTHLHILEAYTNLFRVWKDERLQHQLTNLIEIFIERIINHQTNSFDLFFDENWNPKSKETSFGHDIEGSWLLYEATEVLGNKELLKKVQDITIKMAAQVANNGIDADGAVLNEGQYGKIIDYDKHWWPQAEGIVGFINAWQLTNDPRHLTHAFNIWNFTKDKIIDNENGEWYFRVNRSGIPYTEEDKVGPWKCPYHNGRACLEIIERYNNLMIK